MTKSAGSMILMVLSWSSDDVFPWSLDIKVDEEDIRLKTMVIPNLRKDKTFVEVELSKQSYCHHQFCASQYLVTVCASISFREEN